MLIQFVRIFKDDSFLKRERIRQHETSIRTHKYEQAAWVETEQIHERHQFLSNNTCQQLIVADNKTLAEPFSTHISIPKHGAYTRTKLRCNGDETKVEMFSSMFGENQTQHISTNTSYQLSSMVAKG